MKNVPSRVWIQNDTPRHRTKLEELGEEPSADVSDSFVEYTRAASLITSDAAMVRAGMHEAAKIADSQGMTDIARDILSCSADNEILDRVVTRVKGND